MQQEEKEEEEREEEEGWRSSRKRRRSSERRHHVHPSLSGSAAPWRRQHRPHRIPQRFARAAGSKNNIQKWGNEFGEVSEQDDVEIVVTNIVNPASFLSGSTGEPVIHECLETIEATYSSRQDLKDTPLEDAETCLLMEAAMSSVEEDMLGMQLPQARSLFANRISSHLIFHTVLLLLLIDNLIPSHGEMSRSSFEWIDQPDSGAGPV
ncbi:hypothetical protein DUI87_34916 [Hirundo rustica rustica]|uniref:Uncharacterized protein n=1 Tax=Hirundo rustica rustica TaxID=333673 RepID=A0A3M0J262_HIRRU|nr:hypothetical protein DUI87_34916 [Hirundo rustica rustica]